MTSPAVKAWTSFLLAAIALYGSFTIWKVYKANQTAATTMRREGSAEPTKPLSEVLPPVPLDEFTFIDSEGEPFAMEQLAGKVWVASYFFATCPGFCLQMNQEIAKIVRDLADDDVKFVSFTVDPENDTPEELKQYAERMQADPQRWVFLTGKQDDIQTLGQQYLKMPATKEHNDKLVLIGPDARIHGFFSSRDPLQVKKLEQKIAECVAVAATEQRGSATHGKTSYLGRFGPHPPFADVEPVGEIEINQATAPLGPIQLVWMVNKIFAAYRQSPSPSAQGGWGRALAAFYCLAHHLLHHPGKLDGVGSSPSPCPLVALSPCLTSAATEAAQ